MAVEKTQRDLIPVPDPTAVTTENINEAKEDLRRELQTEMKCLKELILEKFKSVDQRFGDNKLAIDAALSTAEKAVTKSEAGFTKQIDDMAKTFKATTDGLSRTGDDLKERIGSVEGQARGGADTKSDNRGLIAIIISAASVIVSILIGMAMILLRKG